MSTSENVCVAAASVANVVMKLLLAITRVHVETGLGILLMTGNRRKNVLIAILSIFHAYLLKHKNTNMNIYIFSYIHKNN